ncbi:MAG: hypothetical protein UV80_C0007G0074 [Candidatus Peregrinibacteria bacterium GW2011_GWF2_43_17]|nr:MAG: hypothetical protein UV80_C0007G0074 [Candidatus Peregrinibacteria bacterium GW2011_GWF2_43_17]KKT19209.1 MAG: Acylphosphatase [Candidatus Peregrinibacteria bacterium GW2011_GWA2_43_8]HAU39616.1 acylphosphatase [Candidatus Peregrinibacteria bacterium]
MIAYILTIYGKVQGVFYRDFVQENAKKLHITGWVKNETDGSVSAFVQGERGNLLALIDILETGPSHADVTRIEKTALLPEESLKEFTIK